MADNVGYTPGTGAIIAADDVGGVLMQIVKLDVGGDGTSTPVSGALPVSGPITDAQLRATAVPVSGPLTDAQLRATSVPVSGPLTDAQLRATAVPISNAALTSLDSKTPALVSGASPVIGTDTTIPYATDPAVVTANKPQALWRTTFAKAIASGLDTELFTLIGSIGSGQGVSQSGGNALFTTGTTTNSETIYRSVVSWKDMLELRYQTILSQRIVNQQFFVELVDVLGDGLALTVNSATSVTVVIPGTTLTSANVGQSVNIGAVAGVSGAIPGRYAIASVAGTSVTFTVAGWPASGSGTCSLFGMNYHRVEYSGATATNAFYDTQRRGYNSGNTTATINTTASPGHMGIVTSEDGMGSYLDQLVASATTTQTTMRASRVVNIPDETASLFLQLRMVNGSTAPASTTTWTVGMTSVSNYAATNVSINSIRPQPFNSALPVAVNNSPAVTVSSGTVTTVTTVTTLSTLTGGNAAEDAATTASPIIVGGVVRTAVAPTTLIAGDAARATITSGAALVTKPYSVPEIDWTYAAAAGGILNTTVAVTIKAAAAAGVRNYITGIQVQAEALGTATELAVRDGAAGTVLWRIKIGTAGLPFANFDFPTPLRGTAATLLEVVTLTASTTGAVYFNAQGYTAP